jgi:hypothetical protein
MSTIRLHDGRVVEVSECVDAWQYLAFVLAHVLPSGIAFALYHISDSRKWVNAVVEAGFLSRDEAGIIGEYALLTHKWPVFKTNKPLERYRGEYCRIARNDTYGERAWRTKTRSEVSKDAARIIIRFVRLTG